MIVNFCPTLKINNLNNLIDFFSDTGDTSMDDIFSDRSTPDDNSGATTTGWRLQGDNGRATAPGFAANVSSSATSSFQQIDEVSFSRASAFGRVLRQSSSTFDAFLTSKGPTLTSVYSADGQMRSLVERIARPLYIRIYVDALSSKLFLVCLVAIALLQCLCLFVSLCFCTFVCVHVCMYVCMCVCVCVSIYATLLRFCRWMMPIQRRAVWGSGVAWRDGVMGREPMLIN